MSQADENLHSGMLPGLRFDLGRHAVHVSVLIMSACGASKALTLAPAVITLAHTEG